jgi:hypothetical protein
LLTAALGGHAVTFDDLASRCHSCRLTIGPWRDPGSCDKLQNVSAFDIAVIVLVARSNSIDDLWPLLPRIPEALVARTLV